jgi:hypothetical protein
MRRAVLVIRVAHDQVGFKRSSSWIIIIIIIIIMIMIIVKWAWINDDVAVGSRGLPGGRAVKRPLTSFRVRQHTFIIELFKSVDPDFAAHAAGGVYPHVLQNVFHRDERKVENK